MISLPKIARKIVNKCRQYVPKIVSVAVKAAAVVLPVLATGGQSFAQEAATTAANVASTVPEAPVLWWQAIILGIVQGLTEFIPVSSSGHLNIVHAIMGHPRQLAYDVFLSIGTTVALIWYFRHDWKNLLTLQSWAKLRNLIFISCIPAVIVGVLLRDLQDTGPFSDPKFNALCMMIAGAVLLWSDKVGSKRREVKNATVVDALLVGASQAVALIPGVSRSGSTMTAGLFLGFKREDAARFSFLMSLPINLGATFYEIYGMTKPDATPMNASIFTMVLGIVAAGVSGFWAITFLLNYLKTRDVTPFFIWRLVVGLATIAYFSSRLG
jgi:undecaprenyl-diphosphatase